MYKTSHSWLFKSDATRWATRPLYWVMFVISLLLVLTVILSWLGFAILGYLIVSALMSRAHWNRYVVSLQTQAQTDAMNRMAAAAERRG